MKKIIAALFFYCAITQTGELPCEMYNAILSHFDLSPEPWALLAMSTQHGEQEIARVQQIKDEYKERWIAWTKRLLALADRRLVDAIDVESHFDGATTIKQLYDAGLDFLKTDLETFARLAQLPLDELSGLAIFTQYKTQKNSEYASKFGHRAGEIITAKSLCLIDLCLWNNHEQEYLQLAQLTKSCGNSVHGNVDCVEGCLQGCALGACFSGNIRLVKYVLSQMFQGDKADLLDSILIYVSRYIWAQLPQRLKTLDRLREHFAALPPENFLAFKNYIKEIVLVIKQLGFTGDLSIRHDLTELFLVCDCNLIELFPA